MTLHLVPTLLSLHSEIPTPLCWKSREVVHPLLHILPRSVMQIHLIPPKDTPQNQIQLAECKTTLYQSSTDHSSSF